MTASQRSPPGCPHAPAHPGRVRRAGTIVGPGKLLRRAIEADRLFSSIILWGPPGTGKTTLAMVIANQTRMHFVTLSAVLAGKAELREVIDAALERRSSITRYHPVCGRGPSLE